MLLLVILAPIIYWKKRAPYREANPKEKIKTALNKKLLRFVVLFSMLGMGFMLVEISTIQRFILFLGQPVLSLSVLLFSLLVGAGIGSIYSGRFTVVAVLLIYAFSLSFILNQLLGLELAIRLLATVAMLTPLGFLMGFLFPLGLRLLKEMRMADYIPWMWGINGIGSVLGSAMTIVVAISFGFTEALLLGAGCYFVVFLIFQTARHKKELVLERR
jgi:MFS family permease